MHSFAHIYVCDFAKLSIFADFAKDEEHSVLISSHIVSDLEKICDYIAFLHNGRLLVCEEKDFLLNKYGIIHLSREDFMNMEKASVIYRKESAYGVEAVVLRDTVPEGIQVYPVSLEELFVAMVKGEL